MDQNAISFLRDSLGHQHNMRNSLDSKASFLLAVAGVVFGLSIAKLEEIQFVVIALTSFVTIILTVLAVFLPYRGKIKEKGSLLCWWTMLGKKFEDYRKEAQQVLNSEEKITDEYLKEIWNLANYSLKPKSLLLKWASLILTAGLLLGFILFFI